MRKVSKERIQYLETVMSNASAVELTLGGMAQTAEAILDAIADGAAFDSVIYRQFLTAFQRSLERNGIQHSMTAIED